MVSLRSKITIKLLNYYFLNKGASNYINELAKILEVDPKNLYRKLNELEKEGLFESEFRGKQRYYRLSRNFPLLEQYKDIFEQTCGIADGKKKRIVADDMLNIDEAVPTIDVIYAVDGKATPDRKNRVRQLESALDEGHRCSSRDIFNARLNNFFVATNDPLLTAVCGEIGNNAFDHNPGNWHDIAGLYFNYDQPHLAVFIDRGQGVMSSLKKVRPKIQSDLQAVKTAFTERVSGRDPEQRGNGLKFVAEAAMKNGWELFFQSGNGICFIDGGIMGFRASGAGKYLKGCFAVLKYR
ncbi:MAG: winged helix-turn-helix domain-containing protein [bacterium]